MNGFSKNDLLKLIKDQPLRRALTKESHKVFFLVYFNPYIEYELAPFHHEMFRLSEDENNKITAVMSFRGSGKSTIMNTSLSIWSILGVQQKKFVLILSETQEQARIHLKNLKNVLEENDLLKADLGPFKEIEESWNATTLVIPKYGARITVASSEQSVRGMRNNQYRPDLIIADDIESSPSVKNRDGRNKIDDWFTSEILPLGDRKTRIVVLGNQLHRDSLMLRLHERIERKELSGTFRRYPLLGEDGKPLWPGKFKNEADIEALKSSIGRSDIFQREYMLKLVDGVDQVISKKWITTYDTLPDLEREELPRKRLHSVRVFGKEPEVDESQEYRATIVGIDPAISLAETADYTAMVAARVYGYGDKMRIFVLPHIINERLTLEQIVGKAKSFEDEYPRDEIRYVVEDVAAQGFLIQMMQGHGMHVISMKVTGMSKHSRLMNTTPHFEKGRILFPNGDARQLIDQLLDFGTEKHDDLADAFSSIIAEVSANFYRPQQTGYVGPTMLGDTIVGNIWIKQF